MTGGGQAPGSGASSWIQSIRNSRQFALLKAAVKFLQDNRASVDDGGDPETAEKLKEINRSQNDSCPFLKSVLNCMFVSIGVVLLLGVVAVIIYTSIVKPGSNEDIFRNIWMSYLSSQQDDSTLHFVTMEESSTDQHQQQLPSDVQPPVFAAVQHYDMESPSSHSEVLNTESINPERKRDPFVPTLDNGKQLTVNKRPRSELQSVTVPEKTEVRCRFVPVVYRGQTVVQLGQICYEVAQTTTPSSSTLL